MSWPLRACSLTVVLVIVGLRPTNALAEPLSMDQAVALALERNRDVIAARLEVRAVELDQIASGLYPNPTLSYQVGNATLGAGNSSNAQSGAPVNPGLSQLVQTVGISDVI